jgi:hypothetical protein
MEVIALYGKQTNNGDLNNLPAVLCRGLVVERVVQIELMSGINCNAEQLTTKYETVTLS